MIASKQRIYSKPWLGRRFVLTEDSITWGRYEVAGSGIRELSGGKHDVTRTSVRDADPGEIAAAFERLLGMYQPDALHCFLIEMQAMVTYHDAKEHVKTLAHTARTRADYDKVRAAMASAFEAALSVVFEAAKPIHGLAGASFVCYRQLLHGMHLAAFTDGNEMYEVAFRPDLVLECISKDSDYSCVWPRCRKGDAE